MAEIIPFKSLRYAEKKIKNISEVIAPPYDIISESQKESLKNNPNNIVNLTLPDDSESKNRYESAKECLNKWIYEGILSVEKENCFYLLETSFEENGSKKSFLGIIGLLKIEEYGKGQILRHEKTLPKPKEDRLNLLKECRSNFEFIYTVYNDSDNKIKSILNTIIKTKPDVSAKADYDPKLSFSLWKINNKDIIKNISELMKPKTLLIADGHHRYETSRMYKELQNFNLNQDISLNSKDFKPENYILSLFAAGNQENIMIHPTHRLIKFDKTLKPDVFIKKIEKFFEFENILNTDYEKLEKKVKNLSAPFVRQLAVCFKDSECFLLKLKRDIKEIYKELHISLQDYNEDFEYLDVNILHKIIIENILNDFTIKEIKYVHTIKESLEIINRKNVNEVPQNYDACFILNAPSIETVEKLSFEGLIMPQKSTYFYPKPCSGLVIYKMDQ